MGYYGTFNSPMELDELARRALLKIALGIETEDLTEEELLALTIRMKEAMKSPRD